jgi:hypothetical protein
MKTMKMPTPNMMILGSLEGKEHFFGEGEDRERYAKRFVAFGILETPLHALNAGELPTFLGYEAWTYLLNPEKPSGPPWTEGVKCKSKNAAMADIFARMQADTE